MDIISVIGATGAVGQELLQILQQRKFPLKTLKCYASSRSEGKLVSYNNSDIRIEPLTLESLQGTDLYFFAAGSSISKLWIPQIENGTVIDLSSAFRDTAPLIIPEINPSSCLEHQGLISSPNCAATLLLMPLAPLHVAFHAKRIVLSTYQAASGGGFSLMNKLQEETKSFFQGTLSEEQPYAFNVFPHPSSLLDCGYVEEEKKIIQETKKILNAPHLKISPTCVRVPVLRAHALSVNVSFESSFTLSQVYNILSQTPGVTIFEERAKNRFATPLDAAGKDPVFCGRFRMDSSAPNTLEFWIVGDQLRKGAALNAVQIAELLVIHQSCKR